MTEAVSSMGGALARSSAKSCSATTFFFFAGVFFRAARFFAGFFGGAPSVTPSPKESSLPAASTEASSSVFLRRVRVTFFRVAVALVLRAGEVFSSALELLVGIGNPVFLNE
jgi:hypothetical protein